MKEEKPIVIFDGYCSLCNGTVDFIMRHDPKGQFLFSANQHEPGQQLLMAHGIDPENVTTVYLIENGQLYQRSTAALRIVRHLGLPFSLLYPFILIPPFIRDAVYKVIAKNRYNWFGKRDTCRLPTPDERARFLI
ncbi:MAG: thiol-disulfide oxidoreductase DCC family protein [Bacteroidota bacterium]